MSFWDVKLYDSNGEEKETIRQLNKIQKDVLLEALGREGIAAQAFNYTDDGKKIPGSEIDPKIDDLYEAVEMLDKLIEYWRDSSKNYAEYYVDAYQSIRKNIAGELKE